MVSLISVGICFWLALFFVATAFDFVSDNLLLLLSLLHSYSTVSLFTNLPTGFALGFGGQEGSDKTTFVGTKDFLNIGPSAAVWFFQYTFSATSVTIVAGTLAERCQMAAYLCYSIFLAGFIYPVVAHSVWSNNGFLSAANANPLLEVGALDFAGSGVVHVTGGTTALFATLVLGPRRGRFYDAQGEPLETPKPFPGHSVALQLLGTMILWFGCKCYPKKDPAMDPLDIFCFFLPIVICEILTPSFPNPSFFFPGTFFLMVY